MRLAVLLTLLVGPAFAAEPTCTNDVCPLHRRARPTPPRFDATTVTTVTGRVQRVLREDHGGWEGVHLELATDSGALSVALGPALFIDLYARYAPQDVVTVTGSRVLHQGVAVLLPTSISRNGQVVELRTGDGQPLF